MVESQKSMALSSKERTLLVVSMVAIIAIAIVVGRTAVVLFP